MMTKQAMWSNLEITSLHAAIDLENHNQLLAGYTGNLDEAIAAFREAHPDLQGQPRQSSPLPCGWA
jgi:enoyl-CoA hydratase